MLFIILQILLKKNINLMKKQLKFTEKNLYKKKIRQFKNYEYFLKNKIFVKIQVKNNTLLNYVF